MSLFKPGVSAEGKMSALPRGWRSG